MVPIQPIKQLDYLFIALGTLNYASVQGITV